MEAQHKTENPLEQRINEIILYSVERRITNEEYYHYPRFTWSPYPSKIEIIDGKPVIRANKYTMGDGILGLCWKYSGLILILEGLQGEDFTRVLNHELTHREHVMWNEETVRKRTETTNYHPNTLVSYLS